MERPDGTWKCGVRGQKSGLDLPPHPLHLQGPDALVSLKASPRSLTLVPASSRVCPQLCAPSWRTAHATLWEGQDLGRPSGVAAARIPVSGLLKAMEVPQAGALALRVPRAACPEASHAACIDSGSPSPQRSL